MKESSTHLNAVERLYPVVFALPGAARLPSASLIAIAGKFGCPVGTAEIDSACLVVQHVQSASRSHWTVSWVTGERGRSPLLSVREARD